VATPKKAPEDKLKTGRPSKYTDKTAEQARKLCLLGATDEQLADHFEVALSTISGWKNEHPEFLEALKAGKEEADARVAERLFQRAMGYEHDEVDIRVVSGEIVQTPIRKYYPPDTTAGIFWLKNRQKANWRDRIDTEITGKDGGPIQTEEMSPNDLARRIAFTLANGLKKPD
jgi:hypothetical protein